MFMIEIKNSKYIIDGEEQFLISGEFQYFRVPKKDWRKRMIQFKEMHGNCVATYVPWSVHEPTEGEIFWGDVENRDLCAYLDLCAELEMNVVLRPGPLQYSELVYGGIPRWVYQKYPQLRTQRYDGSFLDFPSYMHPVFLEKARRYFSEFARVTRQYMSENGGPVTMLQLDNELMGGQIWSGTIDYNKETYGIGDENGHYAEYLKKKYGTLDKVNKAYNKEYKSFAEIYPAEPGSDDIGDCRSARDFFNLYIEMNGKYLQILTSWLREDGINECVCHNAANASMNGLFDSILDMQEEGFLLGSDYYYNLGQHWKQNNPTPQYALTVFFSSEQLKNIKMPPTAMEMPGGSCNDVPPILSEDLMACYMTNVAFGLRGLNYYIYTGGPNFGDTGNTCDIYDFNALVRADGTINNTYYAAQRFGEFLENNKWLQSAERVTSVNVAYENECFRSEFYQYKGVNYPQYETLEFIRNGVVYSLMCSGFAPSLIDISRCVPDTDKPMILCCPTALSKASQENAVEFLKRGGKLIIMPELPELDENYNKCTILKDYVGIQTKEYTSGEQEPVVCDGEKEKIYGITVKSVITEGVDYAIAKHDRSGGTVIAGKKIDNGTVIFGTTSFTLTLYTQIYMMENLLRRLDTKEIVGHTNPHVFTSMFESENGRKIIFLMNLYSGRNVTDITVVGKTIKDITLAPMEVKTIEI